MPNDKSIRLAEPIYNRLAKQQLPRESISQTVDRLLTLQEEMQNLAGLFIKLVKRDK